MLIFSTPVLIRHLWQLKIVVFLHWCLINALLLSLVTLLFVIPLKWCPLLSMNYKNVLFHCFRQVKPFLTNECACPSIVPCIEQGTLQSLDILDLAFNIWRGYFHAIGFSMKLTHLSKVQYWLNNSWSKVIIHNRMAWSHFFKTVDN